MNFVDSTDVVKQLFPLTLTRSIADIRIGILTIREKWAASALAHLHLEIPAHFIPTPDVVEALKNGKPLESCPDRMMVQYPWQIFELNDRAIRQDFETLTRGRVSESIAGSNNVIGTSGVFLEAGAEVEHSVLNASTGPIYIGRNATVMEGSTIRGPFALCQGAVVKMGARVYGATTVGPYCVVGGEIKNSVLFGYSNKAHDGYLGDSVIGEWCNLGAGTSNSNVKNTAAEITMVNPLTGEQVIAGRKCGLLMGDYCRSAINTSFNTGTVTGVSCNIFGQGLMPRYIPSFSWGGADGTRYQFDKALRDIANWMLFKNHSLGEPEILKLKHIFDHHNI